MHAIQTADFSSRLKREFISKNNVSLKQPELKTAVGQLSLFLLRQRPINREHYDVWWSRAWGLFYLSQPFFQGKGAATNFIDSCRCTHVSHWKKGLCLNQQQAFEQVKRTQSFCLPKMAPEPGAGRLILISATIFISRGAWVLLLSKLVSLSCNFCSCLVRRQVN